MAQLRNFSLAPLFSSYFIKFYNTSANHAILSQNNTKAKGKTNLKTNYSLSMPFLARIWGGGQAKMCLKLIFLVIFIKFVENHHIFFLKFTCLLKNTDFQQ